MITATELWERTITYVRAQLGPDAEPMTVQKVATEVYKVMKFLVQP